MDPKFERKIEEVFKIFLLLASSPAHASVFKTHAKALAPVEFIMSAVLIGRFKDTLSLAGLAGAIDGVRKAVRAVHKDIKNNSRMYATMYTYLDKVKVPVIPHSETAAATLKETAAMKRKRSESPDAPLAQMLQKKLKQMPPPAPVRPQPVASGSSSSSNYRIPKLKPVQAPTATQSPTSSATPPPPTPTPITTPSPVVPSPLSSIFSQQDEDVKPVISHSSSSRSMPRLAFRATPLATPDPAKSQIDVEQARRSFVHTPGGLLGARQPLVFRRSETPNAKPGG